MRFSRATIRLIGVALLAAVAIGDVLGATAIPMGSRDSASDVETSVDETAAKFRWQSPPPVAPPRWQLKALAKPTTCQPSELILVDGFETTPDSIQDPFRT